MFQEIIKYLVNTDNVSIIIWYLVSMTRYLVIVLYEIYQRMLIALYLVMN